MQFTHWQPGSVGARRRYLLLLAVPAGMALLSLATACNQPSASPPAQAAQTPGAETAVVKVLQPEKKNVRRLIERPGYNIEAFERTLLYANITGYVQKWNVDIGDRVKKDDVLAEIGVPEMEVELTQKEAAIRQAAAEIEQAKAAVQRAEAEQERAKSQYDRLVRVEKSGVLDKEQVDEIRLGFKAAKATVAKAKADVSVAEARLEVSKADRDHVQTLLQYTKIRAPFDGVVTRRHVNTRDLAQPSAASKGDALFVVEKVDPLRVVVNVQELEAVWVRDGDTALIRPQSLPGQQFKGKVTRTSGSLNPQNRTLRTEIHLPNADGKLLPGMYVTVTIIAEHKNVWSLPVAAVVTQGEQTFCYRVEYGKAVRTPIQVGLRGDKLVEVLKKQARSAKGAQESGWEDFSGEEVIVASDIASLTDGKAVSISTSKK
jgi:HlyD family secretion protein